MTKIEEFLTKFDDQHLANLQCAAEDGRLVFMDACNCLLFHFRGQYSETKWDPEIGPLAREAESQFLRLGGYEPDTMTVGPNGEWRVITGEAEMKPYYQEDGITIYLGSTKGGDPDRRLGILPMIRAEWARRAKEVVSAQTTENGNEISGIETFTEPSPAVR